MKNNFDSEKKTPLCEIMGRHGSDKGHINSCHTQHNYTTLYYSIFKNIRCDILRIFELGLGTNDVNIKSNMGKFGIPGASLYGWEEFFPTGLIFGADIDSKILFNTERIKTFYCDQTNKNDIINMWNNNELLENFDIIIEDGLHTFSANVCFFENSIHKLKHNGYYVIEDIMNSEILLFKNKIIEWQNRYMHLTFDLIQIPSINKPNDNNLLVIHYN